MSARLGKYIKHKVSGESYCSFLPASLPPSPSLDLSVLSGLLEKATVAVGELNSISHSIPNPSLFIYMYVRKEALLSSQIEGTQSSFSDLMLFENNQKPNVSIEDVEEVSNYVQAIQYGLKKLRSGFPMSLRLLKEIHEILLSGSRGAHMLPGEFRQSQNWIGGTRPGNALFVPPHVNNLMDCLSNFELFLHDDDLPTLLKAGVAHVQFETIHPFLDGNGRLGRLLISLLLCGKGVLKEPVLYLSLYLKQNRKQYYDLLQEVRIHGNWEVWLEFFLEGVIFSATQAIHVTQKIINLFEEDELKIKGLGRARFSCEKTLELFKKIPQLSVDAVSKSLEISSPTARKSLTHLLELGILEEVTGKQRDRVYIYRDYLDLLSEGAEPL